MRKIIVIFLLLFCISLNATKFNPISPKLHLLIGAEPDSPEVLYFLHKIGLSLEDFSENNYAEIMYKSANLFIYMPLNEGFRWIDITIENPKKAKKIFKELIRFYQIPANYKDMNDYLQKEDTVNADDLYFDETEWEDIDWEEYGKELQAANLGESGFIWQEDEDNIEEKKTIYYKPEESYLGSVHVSYLKQKDDEFLLSTIEISGEYYSDPTDSWNKEAEKYYKKLSEYEKEKISQLVRFSKEKEEQHQLEVAVEIAEEEEAERLEVEKIRQEKAAMITIWDNFLVDINDLEQILYIFTLEVITNSDISDLEKKYNFSNFLGNGEMYYSPESKISISIEKNDNKINVQEINYRLDENQEIPLLGVNQNLTIDDLKNKFGKPFHHSWEEYYVLASTDETDYSKMELSIRFIMTGYDGEISSIDFTANEPTPLNYSGKLLPIESGCLDGDCENGKGVYQYSDGVWVYGLFRDGTLYGGKPEVYNYEKREDDRYSRLFDSSTKYKYKESSSFWSNFLHDDSTRKIVELFNKKDYTDADWEILENNYWFYLNDDHYISADKKIIIEYDKETKSFVKSIKLNISNLEDLRTFGALKQYSYDDLVSAFGEELFDTKLFYTSIMMPDGNEDKTDHIEVDFMMKTDNSEIKSITLKPIYPKEIEIDNTLVFIPTGVVSDGNVYYQWIDGHRFVGKFNKGIPWEGKVYYYENDDVYMTLTNGENKSGSEPSIVKKAMEERDPLLKAMDFLTDYLHEFNKKKTMMYIYLEDISEEPENVETNWKGLQRHCNEGLDILNKANEEIWYVRDLIEEKDLDCQLAISNAQKVMSCIRYLEEFTRTIMKIGSQYGIPKQEDMDVLDQHDDWNWKINNAHAKIITDLNDCGFFLK